MNRRMAAFEGVEALEGRYLLSGASSVDFEQVLALGPATRPGHYELWGFKTMAVAPDGSMYAVSSFGNVVGPTDLDPRRNHTMMVDPRGGTLLVKFSAKGRPLWVRWFGHPRNGGSLGISALAMDKEGNLFCAGAVSDEVQLGRHDHVDSIASDGPSSAMMLKLNSKGRVLYARTIDGGVLEIGVPSDLAIDGRGNAVVTGSYTGLTATQTWTGAYAVAIGASGETLWVKGLGKGRGQSVSIDRRDRPHVLMDIRPQAGVPETDYQNTLAAAKLDASGKVLWLKDLVNNFENREVSAAGIAVNRDGNFYVAGNFRGGKIDADPGSGTVTLKTATASSEEVFVSKFNKDGELQWAKKPARTAPRASGSSYIIASDIVVPEDGGVIVTGSYNAPHDFNSGKGETILDPRPASDAFVWAMDHAGRFQWANTLGEAGASELVVSVGLSGSGRFYAGVMAWNPSAKMSPLRLYAAQIPTDRWRLQGG